VTISGNSGFVGSVAANTVTLNSGVSFHYDEALASLASAIYSPYSWNEY